MCICTTFMFTLIVTFVYVTYVQALFDEPFSLLYNPIFDS